LDSVEDIVLIGPVAVGKTTVGRLLAAELAVPLVSMDDHRFDYYREAGYDDELVRRILAAEGPDGVLSYWSRFDPYSIERLLKDHRGSVIDMGGGSTVCDTPEQLARTKAALAPYPNVVLLMPFADRERSLAFLNQRTGHTDRAPHGNSRFVGHPSNDELARMTVLVAGRTPEEVAHAVLSVCERGQDFTG